MLSKILIDLEVKTNFCQMNVFVTNFFHCINRATNISIENWKRKVVKTNLCLLLNISANCWLMRSLRPKEKLV